MKCFHFPSIERDHRRDYDNEDGVVSSSCRTSRVSWARSLSVASSTLVRNSEFDDTDSSFNDTLAFHDFLSLRRANNLLLFSFSQLKTATRGFSRALLIGEGGFGPVYRGTLSVPDDGDGDGDGLSEVQMEVAIKQLNRNGHQGHKEWINEVNLLGVIKHPNLVRLVGYCAEDDERGIQRLLVYELMPNKSLEDHLLARVSSMSTLPWTTRLKIAQDAARGLAYLHEEMDFQVVGTIGYAAPEYVQTGKLTAKSDVWSFGVVLYELITGRRAVERNLPRNEQRLLEWVRPYVSDPRKFHVIVDPKLEGQYCMKSAQKLATLANKCLMKQPKSRPKMSDVVEFLANILNDTIQEESIPQAVVANGEEKVKPSSVKDIEPEPAAKQGNNYLKKVFEFRDMVSLRNKSIGRLDWKNWAPGLVRTW
ncbi:probable serine/threonine-protein kinase PBL19 isoform X2 [Arachis ipaensis]|uniref:probable serine/threonine-protein kinase PBL19 isoform X2 n=1 Tax=Arachis ipaensis TaxID=130454 RepID=UPI000A2B6859|nr:probable serine/threonine-protein kinase PBL19 isoform X2 [Arachis ipaensis]XP_025641959.1 serine/threonine-protein kinase PCRK1 isoform X2 [Arachis hypogaea]